jgi:hypothetical protein
MSKNFEQKVCEEMDAAHQRYRKLELRRLDMQQSAQLVTTTTATVYYDEDGEERIGTGAKPKSKSSKLSPRPEDLMPSGILKGNRGSYAQRMSIGDFKKLSEHWIECAKHDAKSMGITLRPSTSEIDAKYVRS